MTVVDPIAELLKALAEDGKPSMHWVLKHSQDRRDPVHVAFERSEDLDAMVQLLQPPFSLKRPSLRFSVEPATEGLVNPAKANVWAEEATPLTAERLMEAYRLMFGGAPKRKPWTHVRVMGAWFTGHEAREALRAAVIHVPTLTDLMDHARAVTPG